MTPQEFFGSLRYLRSRTNATDFMAWLFPNKPFDDYHMNKWVMFRDDIHGFWCHSDTDIQSKIEGALKALVLEGKK